MAHRRYRWSPKLPPERLRRLYHSDARAMLDEALLDDIGLTLFLRCCDILLVTAGQTRCPDCTRLLSFANCHTVPDQPLVCPDCGLITAYRQFHESWRHRELNRGNAVPAFRAFADRYLGARTPRARLLLIDALIHAVHLSIKGAVGRQAAENVIEEIKRQVLALLDDLAFAGDRSRRDEGG